MAFNTSRSFTIGALAKQAEVAIDTIRYYEREGLLPRPQRRASGYREYGEATLRRVRFIRRAKDLGFTLDEIRELLELETDRERGVEVVKQRAMKRLEELDRRLAQLTEMRNELAQLVEACPGCGEPECCPILSTMHGEEVLVEVVPVASAVSSCCQGSHAEQRSSSKP